MAHPMVQERTARMRARRKRHYRFAVGLIIFVALVIAAGLAANIYGGAGVKLAAAIAIAIFLAFTVALAAR